MGGDYVTLNQLVTAFNRTGSYSYKMISWVENRGLPVHNKRVQQNTFRVVYLKEFWTWAEKNRSFLDFSKLEPLAFGEEPAWVAEQRKRDFKACSLQRKDPWTPAEDAKLRMLLEQYKYTYEQMSDMLRRSPGAIQRRCADLGLKAARCASTRMARGRSGTKKTTTGWPRVSRAAKAICPSAKHWVSPKRPFAEKSTTATSPRTPTRFAP